MTTTSKEKPLWLEAKVGEYRPLGDRTVRISAEGCVLQTDLHLLLGAQQVQRWRWSSWDEPRLKAYTRLMVQGKRYLADRVTGTVYDEVSGLCSTHNLRLMDPEEVKI